MIEDLLDLVTDPCELLGLGEPTHREPGIAEIRNGLFARLADHGFGSIALETDRVAALTVNDFVRSGTGNLDEVMATGFTHGFGTMAANRALVAWLREYNDTRPESRRLSFHGFDAPMEMMSAPGPRADLAAVRDYLGTDHDIETPCGADERWSRTEALMDAAASPGATADARRLREIAEELGNLLLARAPELIAESSPARWFRARARWSAGSGLLRYHGYAARPGSDQERWNDMCALRDVLMAENLLDIRRAETGRGATLVFANNAHLGRDRSSLALGPMNLDWNGAGAILSAVLGERYRLVVGSLGTSEAIDLGEAAHGTFEAALSDRDGWGLVRPEAIPDATVRTDTNPAQGYAPLTRSLIDGADAVLHLPRATGRDVGYDAYLAEQRRGYDPG